MLLYTNTQRREGGRDHCEKYVLKLKLPFCPFDMSTVRDFFRHMATLLTLEGDAEKYESNQIACYRTTTEAVVLMRYFC